MFQPSGTTLLVECPSAQCQPDGSTICANKWFLGAGFLGAPPVSLKGRLRQAAGVQSCIIIITTTTTTTTNLITITV